MIILPPPQKKTTFFVHLKKKAATSFIHADMLTSECSFNNISLMIFHN